MKKKALVTSKATLDATLLEIETELIAAIPRGVKRAKLRTTSYGMLVCYIDFTTDEYAPQVHALPESHLASCIANGEVGTIWSLPKVQLVTIDYQPSHALSAKCNAVYDYLSAEWDGEDEFAALLPFRKMIYRVCLVLNDLDWSQLMPVTSEFVVMASDWSTGEMISVDGKASVPPAKQQPLRERGLFFNPRKFKPAKVPAGNGLNTVKKLPPAEQIAYWLKQLELLAAGEECDASRANRGAKRLVAKLLPFGTAASDAVLAFIERQCQLGVWRNDGLRTAGNMLASREAVLGSLFSELGILVAPVKDTERRLWRLFEDAVQRNEGHKLWDTVPTRIAFAIQAVFPDYDYWVVRDDFDRITTLDQIRKAATQEVGLSD